MNASLLIVTVQRILYFLCFFFAEHWNVLTRTAA